MARPRSNRVFDLSLTIRKKALQRRTARPQPGLLTLDRVVIARAGNDPSAKGAKSVVYPTVEPLSSKGGPSRATRRAGAWCPTACENPLVRCWASPSAYFLGARTPDTRADPIQCEKSGSVRLPRYRGEFRQRRGELWRAQRPIFHKPPPTYPGGSWCRNETRQRPGRAIQGTIQPPG